MGVTMRFLFVLVAMGAVAMMELPAVPCDSAWTKGPSCEEIVAELEAQNNRHF